MAASVQGGAEGSASQAAHTAAAGDHTQLKPPVYACCRCPCSMSRLASWEAQTWSRFRSSWVTTVSEPAAAGCLNWQTALTIQSVRITCPTSLITMNLRQQFNSKYTLLRQQCSSRAPHPCSPTRHHPSHPLGTSYIAALAAPRLVPPPLLPCSAECLRLRVLGERPRGAQGR